MRARLMKAKGTWYRIPENARMILYILLSPIFSALLAVTVGELTINALYFGKTELPFASALAFGGNVLILSCTFLILIAAVNRIFLAIILGSSLYGLLIVVNILKLRSFDNPVRPTDIQYLPDLKVIARPSLSAGSVCAAIAIAVAVLLIALFLWKSEKRVFALFPRIGTLMFASAVLVSIFIVPAHSRPRDWLNEQGIELPEWWQFEPRESAKFYDETHYFKADEMEQARQRYSVPAVFWTNFPAVKKDFVRSANFIPAMLLQQLNLQPEGIFALSAEMAAYFPVFSKYMQTVDGRIYEPESPEIPYRRLIENFRTIEYDLLVGKQFVLDLPGWREREPRIIQ